MPARRDGDRHGRRPDPSHDGASQHHKPHPNPKPRHTTATRDTPGSGRESRHGLRTGPGRQRLDRAADSLTNATPEHDVAGNGDMWRRRDRGDTVPTGADDRGTNDTARSVRIGIGIVPSRLGRIGGTWLPPHINPAAATDSTWSRTLGSPCSRAHRMRPDRDPATVSASESYSETTASGTKMTSRVRAIAPGSCLPAGSRSGPPEQKARNPRWSYDTGIMLELNPGGEIRS